jgi:hypothetical protein
MTFGEFFEEWDRDGSGLHGVGKTIFGFVRRVSSAARAGAVARARSQYPLLSATEGHSAGGASAPLIEADVPLIAPLAPPEADIAPFDWRCPLDDPSDDDPEPRARGRAYLDAKLANVSRRSGGTSRSDGRFRCRGRVDIHGMDEQRAHFRRLASRSHPHHCDTVRDESEPLA